MVVWLNVHAHTAAEQLEEKTDRQFWLIRLPTLYTIALAALDVSEFWDDQNLDFTVYRRQLWSTI